MDRICLLILGRLAAKPFSPAGLSVAQGQIWVRVMIKDMLRVDTISLSMNPHPMTVSGRFGSCSRFLKLLIRTDSGVTTFHNNYLKLQRKSSRYASRPTWASVVARRWVTQARSLAELTKSWRPKETTSKQKSGL